MRRTREENNGSETAAAAGAPGALPVPRRAARAGLPRRALSVLLAALLVATMNPLANDAAALAQTAAGAREALGAAAPDGAAAPGEGLGGGLPSTDVAGSAGSGEGEGGGQEPSDGEAGGGDEPPAADIVSRTVPVDPAGEDAEAEGAGGEEAARSYATWAEVAAAVEAGELSGEGFKPAGAGTEADPYAISTPEAFAWWAAYHAADAGTFARLDADVDLTADTYAAREPAGNGSGEGGSGEGEGEAGSQEAPASGDSDSDAAPSDPGTLWIPIPVLAAELDGDGHAVLFRTEGAGLADAIAETGVVRWLSLGRTQKQLDEAAAQGGEAASLAETSVITQGPRAGSVAGTNKGTIEGVVNRMPVSWEPGDAPAPDALAGGIAGENDGRIRDCANLGDVVNANASEGSAAAGIAAAGIGTVETSYNAASVRAAVNGAYLATTLTSDAPYEDLVRASFYLAPGNAAAYEGVSAVGASRPGALSPDELADAAALLNDGREGEAAVWRSAADAGDAAADGATGGYPAPAKPADAQPAPQPEANALAAEPAAEEPAPAAANTHTFASWYEVGKAVYDNASSPNPDFELLPFAQEQPTQIKTPEGLAYWLYSIANGTTSEIVLDLDSHIDLSGTKYSADGGPLPWCSWVAQSANITIDGHGYTISNMHVVGGVESADPSIAFNGGLGMEATYGRGFFATTIKNNGFLKFRNFVLEGEVDLSEGTFTGNQSEAPYCAGALVGGFYMSEHYSMLAENVIVNVDVRGNGFTGGFVGYAGENTSMTLRDCANKGSVTAEGSSDIAAYHIENMGGSNDEEILKTRQAVAGGFAGALFPASVSAGTDEVSITNSHNEGFVTSSNRIAGGIVGYAQGNVDVGSSYNVGTVESKGGYVKPSEYSVGVLVEASTGGVAGGLFGMTINGPRAHECYNRGAVKSGYTAGGLYGVLVETDPLIFDGLAGSTYNASTVTSSFPDSTLPDGQTPSTGQGGGVAGFAVLDGYSNSHFWYDSTLASNRRGTQFYDSSLIYPQPDAATTDDMKRTASFVDALNQYAANGNTKAWSRNASVNDGYPFLSKRDVNMPSVNSWKEVAEWIEFDNYDMGRFKLAGTGSPEDPFKIYSAEQFAYVFFIGIYGRIGSDNRDPLFRPDAYVCIELMADIDLGGFAYGGMAWGSEASYGPLTWDLPSSQGIFVGRFDGNGHRITNMSAHIESGDYQSAGGLFSYVSSEDPERTTSARATSIGGFSIEGEVVSYGSCFGGVVGSVRDDSGKAEPVLVHDITSYLDVRAEGRITDGFGGIVGGTENGAGICNIERCGFAGRVEMSDRNGTPYLGGIAGKLGIDPTRPSSLMDCYATGSIVVEESVGSAGGLVGFVEQGSISNSYAAVSFEGSGSIMAKGLAVGQWQNDPNSASSRIFYDGDIADTFGGKFLGTASSSQFEPYFTRKTTEELKGDVFPVLLNAGRPESVWGTDSANQNKGYPVFGGGTQLADWDEVARLIDRGEIVDLEDNPLWPEKNSEGLYVLDSPEDLAWFSFDVNTRWKEAGTDAIVNSGAVITVDALDMTGAAYGGTADKPLAFTPIGNTFYNSGSGRYDAGRPYRQATFDGGGCTIDNLRIAGITSLDQAMSGDKGLNSALFGSAQESVIQGVNLGANCTAEGTASTNESTFTAGIVGHAWDAIVLDCSFAGSLRVTDLGRDGAVGGIVGVWSGSSAGESGEIVARCAYTGTMELVNEVSSSYMMMSGIVGRVGTNNGGEIVDCYSTGSVAATGFAPNIAAGISSYGIGSIAIRQCYSTGDVHSRETYYTQLCIANPSMFVLEGESCYGVLDGDPSNLYYDCGVFSQILPQDALDDGFVKKLNNGRTGKSAPWVLDAKNVNGGLPVFGVNYGSWADVGEAVAAGKLTGDGFVPEGDGSASKPYRISTPEAFAWFAYKVNNENGTFRSANAEITQPIDLSGKGYTGVTEQELAADPTTALRWIPVVNDYTGMATYTGSFDGHGLDIDNLYVEESLSAALFGGVSTGGVLRGISVASGIVKSGIYGAGVAAGSQKATVENCSNRAAVVGSNAYVGGVLAQANNTTVKNCANFGNLTGKTYVGGVVGGSDSSSSVSGCYSVGSVTATDANPAVGGVVGLVSSSTITNCYYLAGSVNGGNDTTASAALPLTDVQMKSWACAYGLNGKNFGTSNISWTLPADGANGGYPVLGDSLRAAADWSEVGLGVDAGIIDGKPTQAGTSAAPFQLASEEALAWFAYKSNADTANFYNKHAKVMKIELDLTGTTYGGTSAAKLQWMSISEYNTNGKYGHGEDSGNYEGTFDGQGCVIKNLYQQKTDAAENEGFGLFGFVSKGTVKNIVLKDVDIKAESSHWITVGGITSQITGGATISGCGVESGKIVGTVAAANMVGGIAGDSHKNGGVIENCYVRANVGENTAARPGGGILGRALNSGQTTIRNCYFAGTLQGNPVCTDHLNYVTCSNVFYDSTLYTTAVSRTGVKGLTTAQLQSWAAAYALNGGPAGAPWTYDSSKNGGYPSFGILGAPSDWSAVGAGVDLGLVSGTGFKPAQSGADAANAYQISTPEALAWFAYKVNTDTAYRGKFAKITAPIDLSGKAYLGKTPSAADFADCLPWVPIGDPKGTDGTAANVGYYSGTFDGGSQAITNLYVAPRAFHSGLFAVLNGATMENVVVASGQVNGCDRVGGIAGMAYGATTVSIKNCSNAATISSARINNSGTSCNTGGILGTVYGNSSSHAVIEHCSNTGSVKANREAGGIVGMTYTKMSAEVKDCYNTGAVECVSMTGGSNPPYGAGGILGINMSGSGDKTTTISNCYNTGTVKTFGSKTDTLVHAIANSSGTTKIENCYYLENTVQGANDGTSAKALTDAQLKSWAAAFALNGKKMGTTWASDGTSYPTFGSLRAANDWGEVGLGVDAGLIDGMPSLTGTSYTVNGPAGLAWVAWKSQTDDFSGKTVLLGGPIDLLGKEYTGAASAGADFSGCLAWKPIGSNAKPFAGTLEGQGEKVSNLRINATTNYQGLFGALTGKVYETTVLSGSVQGANYIAGIAGLAKSGAVVQNCSTGTGLAVKGDEFAAGIVGEISGGGATIEKCVNDAAVTSGGEAGGIAASAYGSGTSTIKASANKGSVTSTGASKTIGNRSAAGIFARSQSDMNSAKVNITGCYSIGTVTGQGDGRSYGVALVRGSNVTISNCAYDKDKTTSSSSTSDALGVTDRQMKTWAAAYYLNGGALGALGAWASEGAAYPTFGALRDAADWGEVGAGVDAGFIGTAPVPTTDGVGAVYTVSTPEQLAWVAYYLNDAGHRFDQETVKLDSSISETDGLSLAGAKYRSQSSLGSLPWCPIGSNNTFNGEFDGNGKTVRDLEITSSSRGPYTGLFGTVFGPGIKHVGVELGARGIEGGGDTVGGLVGKLVGSLSDCYVRGSGAVNGTGSHVGGLVGWISGATVSNSYAAVDVTGSPSVGAFAGSTVGDKVVINCYYESGRSGSTATSDNAGAKGYAPSVMKSLFLASQLNAGYRESDDAPWSWASDANEGYPGFGGALAKLENWQDVGKVQDEASLRAANSITGGKGSSAGDEMVINDAEALAWFAYMVNTSATLAGGTKAANAYVKLGGTIDLSGKAYTGETSVAADFSNCLKWTPIGSPNSVPYSGTFDGQKNGVSNMRVEGDADLGLFGTIASAVVSNCGVNSGSVTGTGMHVGGFIGYIYSNTGTTASRISTVEGCWNGASVVASNSNTGGVVGSTNPQATSDGARIAKCWNYGAVTQTAGGSVAGIVGKTHTGNRNDIEDCYNTGTITGIKDVAGIIATTNYGPGSVKNCYNVGDVNATGGSAGGIMVSPSNMTLSNNYYLQGCVKEGTEAKPSGVASLTSDQMKSWALAFALNGKNVGAGTTWAMGAAGGYPTFADANGLRAANDWGEVGLGVEAGLIAGKPTTGDGISAPIELGNAEALAWFAYMVNTDRDYGAKSVKLTDNINLDGTTYTGKEKSLDNALPWIPIGKDTTNYYGAAAATSGVGDYTSVVFDGNSKTVDYMRVDVTGNYAGLLGCAHNCTIRGITMGVNSSVKATGNVVGGIVGGYEAWKKNGTVGYGMVVEDCTNRANVTGDSKVGGIAGDIPYNGGSVPGMSRCANYGDVTATTTGDRPIVAGVVAQPGENDLVDCYNRGAISFKNSAGASHVGGIAAQGAGKVTNCYNAGKQTGGQSLCGWYGFTATVVSNSYYDSTLVTGTSNQGKALTSDQMKTWALAFALNGGKAGADTTWTYNASKDSGYPTFGTLGAPADWAAIGAGVDTGLIAGKPTTGDGTSAKPIELGSAEALAWFAYKVNTENAGYKSKKAKLTGNINLSGKDYGGTETSDFTKCLQWVPISPYSGDFDGGGFAVQNLYIDQGTDHVGFFGSLQGIASDDASDMVSVHDFGVASGSVTGVHTVGGVAGSMGRVQNRVDVTVKRCWNNASVKGTGKTGSETMAGGIAGYVNGSIVDCYNTGSVNAAAASAGGIAGSTTSYTGYTRVANCYNTGTVTGSSQYGAINGWHLNSSSPTTNCYYLKGSAPAGFGRDPNNGEAKELTADQLQSWAAAYALNGGKFGDAGVTWTLDAASANAGYPVFGSTLRAANDWGEVGLGVDAGLITGTDFKPAQTGDGEADAYQISTPEALAWFAYKVNDDNANYAGKYAKLTQSINLSGKDYGGTETSDFTKCLKWVPVSSFSGTFDGQGNTVKNLRVDQEGQGGFFAQIESAGLVCGLGVESGSVTTNDYAGGLVGTLYGALDRCWNGATVRTAIDNYDPAGGLAAYGSGKITNCYNVGSVENGDWVYYAGGILGSTPSDKGATVENCYSVGPQNQGYRDFGAIIGNRRSVGSVSNNYYLGGKGFGNADADASEAQQLSTAQLQSWGASYALNGGTGAQKVGDLTTWRKASAGENSGYPVLCAAGESMTPAADWSEVGEWVDAFSPAFKPAEDGTTAACSVGTPEALAWVAYKANNGMPDIKATLTTGVDLAGESYRAADAAAPLGWVPIGASSAYTGTFGGGMSVVKNLSVPAAANRANAGLFGSLGTGAKVSALGVEVAGVSGTAAAGGLAGAMAGGTVEDCYAVSSNGGTVQTASGKAAGLVGSLDGGIVSRSFAAVTLGSGGTKAAFANKGGSTVLATACFYDRSLTGAGTDSSGATGYTNAMMRSVLAATALNNGGQNGVWTWVANVNNGYPSFGVAVAITLWQQVGAVQSEADLRNQPVAASTAGVSNLAPGVDRALKGKGTEADHLVIATPEALAWFAYLVNEGKPIENESGTVDDVPAVSAYVDLAADFDLTGTLYGGKDDNRLVWDRIGKYGSPFQGTFDGLQHELDGLRVEVPDNLGTGLFGSIGGASADSEAVVANVGVGANSIAESGNGRAGMIVGVVYGASRVTGCWNKGKVSSVGSQVGGIAGYVSSNLSSSTSTGASIVIEGCWNGGEATSENGYSGGIAGLSNSGKGQRTFKDCYNVGKVSNASTKYECGGIVGFATGDGGTDIVNCYSAGEVVNSSSTSRVCGISPNGTASNCYYREGSAAGASVGTPLADSVMKSWALAYALNDGKLGADGVWAAVANGYPTFGELRAAADWAEVGLGVDAGLIDSKPVADGDGLYAISSPAQFAWLAYMVNSKKLDASQKATLAKDIDLSGAEYGGSVGTTGDVSDYDTCLLWTPISTFSGSLDGGGFAVKNLRAQAAAGDQGLVLSLSGGTVANLSVASGSVQSVGYAGAVAATVSSGATISFCSTGADLTVSGAALAGGIAGCYLGGPTKVEKCVNAASVVSNGEAGGIVGASYNGGTLSIENCANLGNVETKSLNTGNSAGKNRAAGIFGRTDFALGGSQVSITGCYSSGAVTAAAGGKAYGVSLTRSGGITMSRCMYDKETAPVAESSTNVMALATEQLQSWAAAYALNGADGSKGIAEYQTWRKAARDADGNPTENSGYPALCGAGESMTPAADWGEVGAWVDAFAPSLQPVTGAGGAYEMTSAEQLAWFAFKVNAENATFKTAKVELSNPINLAGTLYTGEDAVASDFSNCLRWIPIGPSESVPFSGDFDGGGFAVENLYVSQSTSIVGFFGTLKGIDSTADADAVSVHDFGVASGSVTGIHTVGGIAGQMKRVQNRANVAVERCWNNASVKGTGTDDRETMAGGIAGYVNGSIVDCYNTGSISAAAPSAGGIAGSTTSVSGYTRVANCYNVGTVTGPSQFGAINGWHHNTSSPTTNCYYLKDSAPSGFGSFKDGTTGGEAKELTDAQMKSWNAAYWLNGNAYVGETDGMQPTSTVWTTDEQKNGSGSLKNEGYPIFGNLTIEKLAVTLDPADISTATGASKKTFGKFMDSDSQEKALSGMAYLVKDPVVPEGITLMDETDVQYGFSTWGTTTANSKFALFANTIIKPSLSLPLVMGRDLTGISLCAAAAYNAKDPCDITFELSDDYAHYQVTATVKAFEGSKTLDVTVPVESASSFELSPDGEVHEGESAAKAAEPSVLKSNNALPLAGRVAKVEPLAAGTERGVDGKEVNAVLNPAAASTALAPTSDPIADGDLATPDNVKLFAAASGADASLTPLGAPLYYDPENGTVPLYFAVPGGKEARWKWGMDYTGTYLGREGVFGYAVSYELGLSASDLAAPSLNGTGYPVAPGVYATEPYAGGGQGRYEVKWSRSAS